MAVCLFDNCWIWVTPHNAINASQLCVISWSSHGGRLGYGEGEGGDGGGGGGEGGGGEGDTHPLHWRTSWSCW